MHILLVYTGAAIAEIAGCFAFWALLRLEKPLWLLIPGTASLLLFAYLLTLVESPAAAALTPLMAVFTSSLRWHGCGAWKGYAPIDGI